MCILKKGTEWNQKLSSRYHEYFRVLFGSEIWSSAIRYIFKAFEYCLERKNILPILIRLEISFNVQ